MSFEKESAEYLKIYRNKFITSFLILMNFIYLFYLIANIFIQVTVFQIVCIYYFSCFIYFVRKYIVDFLYKEEDKSMKEFEDKIMEDKNNGQ